MEKLSGRLMSLFSLSQMFDNFAKAWSRFPMSVVYAGLCALYLIMLTWHLIEPSSSINVAFYNCFAVGFLMSLAIYLWSEFYDLCKSKYYLLTCSVLVSFAVWIYIFNHGGVSEVETLSYSALYTSLSVAILFPVTRGGYKRANWNFSVSLLRGFFVSLVIAITMTVAALLIYFTVESLFGFTSENLLSTVLIMFSFLLPVLCFLSAIPTRQECESSVKPFGKFVRSACKNVLLPLALIYIVVLYFYCLKIIIVWSLPKGVICSMVTGLICVVIPVIFGLQGFLLDDDYKSSQNRVCALATKWLPIIMLPLLMMMSIAISYRIYDHGFTVKRLYVLTFNVWAYVVFAYIFLKHNPKMNMVAVSFAVLFMATSVIPGFNFCTLGIHIVREKLISELKSAGVTELPVSSKELVNLLENLNGEEMVSIAHDVDYLDDWSNPKLLSGIVEGEKGDRYLYRFMHADRKGKKVKIEKHEYKNVPLSPIPTGYTSLRYISKEDFTLFNNKEESRYRIELDDDIYVSFPVDSVLRLDSNQPLEQFSLQVNNDSNALFVVCGAEISVDISDSTNISSLKVEGYLLEK